MSEKRWKVAERQVARFFGTERNPLSGGTSRHTRSDSLHRKLFIETKRGKKHSAVTLWNHANIKALAENKIPVVALLEHNRPGFWIVIKSGDLIKILKELDKVVGEVEGKKD